MIKTKNGNLIRSDSLPVGRYRFTDINE